MNNFSDMEYSRMIDSLFKRFPSFQKVGAGAYKPGMANMEFMDQLLGHPHKKYKVIHIAGTNGKGSVSNMLTSVLVACGYKVGLYTSPHILDFRERMRVVDPAGGYKLVEKEFVWDFVQKWRDTFDHMDMSFFEITTSMAFEWFAEEGVDFVVLETGLGGRLDSTNIVNPVLSVITNIGLDHCDLLGETLPEIAFEKAGIIKPKVPVVVGESDEQTDEVFRRKVLYTNLSEPEYMGDRNAIMGLLTFADKVVPSLWEEAEALLASMDLKGDYQVKNLRTVLAVLDVLRQKEIVEVCEDADVESAISQAAGRTGFRGRWEKVSDVPYMICDIGHNEHGLRHNFSQLERMVESGEVSSLIIVYGSVADKDLNAVLPLMPSDAVYVFTQADNHRALSAELIAQRFSSSGNPAEIHIRISVPDALALSCELAADVQRFGRRPLIYIGGSTYVVSEAIAHLENIRKMC